MVERATPKTQTHYGNAPLLEYAYGSLVLEGYSRAGVQSYWRIPQWKLALDHGNHPWEFSNSTHLALTHFHPDHSAGLTSYLASRGMLALPPPTLIYPAYYHDALVDFLEAWRRLSTDSARCKLHPCKVGDDIPLGQKRILRPFRTIHAVPGHGYAVFELKEKLKPEYLDLPGQEIGRLRAGGEVVTDVIEIPRLAYCGDTTIAALDVNPWLYQVEMLLLEATFVGDSPDARSAREFGHVHIDDLVARAELFANGRVVLGHFSQRLSADDTIARLDRLLPPSLRDRVVAWT